MPTAKAGDINLYYEVHGEGQPLLLIMGYGSNSGHWFVILPHLVSRFKVIIFDNRGTGRSDKPDIPYTAEMMTGDIIGLLDAIGIGAAHVFGVSMGGMIAQELALRHPGRVKKLILGCTSCGGPHSVRSSPESAAFLFDPERAKLSDEERALFNRAVAVERGFYRQAPGGRQALREDHDAISHPDPRLYEPGKFHPDS